MLGKHGDVDDLQPAAGIADDAPHADDLVATRYVDREDGVRQPFGGRLTRFRAQSRLASNVQIIVDTRWLPVELVAQVTILESRSALELPGARIPEITLQHGSTGYNALATDAQR